MLNISSILTFLALNRSVIVGESLLIYIYYVCVCVFSILPRDEKIQFSTENA